MSDRYTHAHPLTKTAQGLLLDLDADDESQTWRDLDTVLAKATEAAKDVEEDRDVYRERALAAEARERALEETVGELLGLVDRPGWIVVRPLNTGRAYEFEVLPGERPVVCIDKRGMLVD